ncbi:MAG: sensor histidine kinase [Dehalococcoidia bacterium]|nr:sensor histidine kinase [Dehalococcoidia bacterium]
MAPTSGFFQSNIILIFFVYGLAFFLMGVVIAVESRRASGLPLARSLWLLGSFGLLNGMVGWIDMFMVMPRPTPGPAVSVLTHVIQPLNCFDCHQRLGASAALGWEPQQVMDLAKVLFLVAAPTALLLFGARLLHDTRDLPGRWHRWVPLGFLGVFFISIFLGRDLIDDGIQERLITAGILARYTLYIPACAVAAVALVAQRRPFAALGLPRIARDITLAAAVFGLGGLLDGLVVPPAPFFPASLINYASFFAVTGIPVQAFRAAVALAIAYFVVRTLRIFEIEYRHRLSVADEERFRAQQEVLAAQQRAKDQLEKWNQELEQRVLQRTREVEQRNREVTILEERERLAGEMHDTLGQVLAYVNLKVLTATQTLSSGMTDKALGELKDMEKAVTAACADVRESILSLKTTVNEKKGLLATLPDFLVRYSEQTGLKVELSTGGLENARFALETEIQLLRIVQEALANVRKHARATRAWLNITGGPKEITFVVGDDGQGFDPASIQQNPGNRFGLQIMKERAERTGGRLEVASSPGQGTRVVINVPRAALEGE